MRAPAGIGGHLFFQKHSGSLHIDDLVELPVALDPEHPPLVEIDSFTALISAAQMNVVEFHTWNALSRAIEKPDRMTFDLDPGDGVGWTAMVAAARLTRALLDEIGLRAFVKTSGGKGLHVVVPLTPREGWDDVKDFSREVVERLATLAPDQLVAKSGPKNRVGRIFVDYLRNGRGATTAAAYSARARAGLGVSIPCDWDELDEPPRRRPLDHRERTRAPRSGRRPVGRLRALPTSARRRPQGAAPRRGGMTTAQSRPHASGISLGARRGETVVQRPEAFDPNPRSMPFQHLSP